MNRAVLLLATAVTASVVMTGCSTPSTGDDGGAQSNVIGIVEINGNDQGVVRFVAGATEAAEAQGWTVQTVDVNGSADQANTAITNYASQGVGMIISLVFPVSSIGGGIAAATGAGVPLATWGGGSGDGVLVNSGDGGPFAEPSTQALIDALDGEGEVLALTYQGGQVCRDRTAIFDEMMADQAPDVTITKEEVTIPGYLQDGADYATAWLAAHPKGSSNLAVWGCWEDPTLGAISALKQQDRTDVFTYGINGSDTAIKAVEEGSMTATVYEDQFAEGKQTVEAMFEAIDAGADWEPKSIDVPGTLVTADNVEEFLVDHPYTTN